MDLYNYTYDLVRQIPDGMVSTYGAVARALGDVRASRAVGRMMNQNPDADTMPCFKIVKSDGKIGGFGLGISDKIRRLKDDGIKVESGSISNFSNVFFNDFQTDFPLKKLRNEQLYLSKKLNFEDNLCEEDIKYVAGFDVAYSFYDDWKKSCGSCVVFDYKTLEIVEQKTILHNTYFPYIPTYLSFRELPFINLLLDKIDIKPSVIILDGNGILHPYHFGIACHAGVINNLSSIGIAKSLLLGKVREDNKIINNKILGYAYYSNKRVKKPVYISQGNKISLKTAINVVIKLSTYKNPEPLRKAHLLATDTLRKNQKNHYLKQPEHLIHYTNS